MTEHRSAAEERRSGSGAEHRSDTHDAPQAEAATADEADELVEGDLDELGRLAVERDEYRELAQRIQADFENYKKRALKLQTEHLERAAQALVVKLLPVLDSFELALANLDGDGDTDRVRKGIELVYAELLGVLERAGLEHIAAQGVPFDPNEHEAVLQEDGDGEPHVGDVLRAGWKLKGRVLRPAMVKVVR